MCDENWRIDEHFSKLMTRRWRHEYNHQKTKTVTKSHRMFVDYTKTRRMTIWGDERALKIEGIISFYWHWSSNRFWPEGWTESLPLPLLSKRRLEDSLFIVSMKGDGLEANSHIEVPNTFTMQFREQDCRPPRTILFSWEFMEHHHLPIYTQASLVSFQCKEIMNWARSLAGSMPMTAVSLAMVQWGIRIYWCPVRKAVRYVQRFRIYSSS